MGSRRTMMAVAILTSILSAGVARSAVITWDSGVSGNWSDPAMWDLGRAPEAGDVVRLTGLGDYTVTLNVNADVTSVKIGNEQTSYSVKLQANNRTLTASTIDVTKQGELVMNNCTLNVANGITQHHLATLFNCTVNGSLRSLKSSSADPAVLTTLRGLNQFSGTLTAGIQSHIACEATSVSGATIVAGSLSVEALAGLSLRTVSGATNVQLTVSGATTINGILDAVAGTGGATFINGGDMVVNSFSQLRMYMPVTLSCRSLVNEGTLQLNADVNASATGAGYSGSGMIEGAGLLRWTGGTFHFDDFITGRLEFSNASVAVRHIFGITTAQFTTATNTNFTGPALIHLRLGETLTLRECNVGANLDNQGGTLLVHGQCTFGGGYVVSSSTVASPARLVVEADTPSGATAFFYGDHAFLANEQLVLRSAGVSGPATLDNSGHYLRFLASASASFEAGAGGSRTLKCSFLENYGSMFVAAPTEVQTTGATNLNDGDISVSAGWFELEQAVTGVMNNVDRVTPGPGTFVRCTGGTWRHNTTELPTGDLRFQSARLQLNRAWNGANTTPSFVNSVIEQSGGSFLFSIPAGASASMQSSSHSAALQNEGTLILSGQTTLGPGFSDAPGAITRVEASPAAGSTAVTLQLPLDIHGTLELTSAGGSAVGLLSAPGPPLHILAGGAFRVLPGTGGARFFTGTLVNDGTVTVSAPLNWSWSNAAQINRGTITLQAPVILTQSGTPASFTNHGTLRFAHPQSPLFTISGGTALNTAGARIEGHGALSLQNGASFTNAGILAPFLTTTGTFAVSGSMTQAATGRIETVLESLPLGNDRVAVSGALTAGGIVAATLGPGYAPMAGAVHDVVTWGSRVGDFDDVEVPVLSAPYALDVDLQPNALRLQISRQMWVQQPPLDEEPEGREGSSALYDPVEDRMIVFGGSKDSGAGKTVASVAGGALTDEVWILDHAGRVSGPPQWRQLRPDPGPRPRQDHCAVLSPDGQSMLVLFGSADGDEALSDVWLLEDIDRSPFWTGVIPGGQPPPARSLAGAAYVPEQDRLVVIGGTPEPLACSAFSDVWFLENAFGIHGSPYWRQAGDDPGHEHRGHLAAYDHIRQHVLVFGGDMECVGTSRRIWVVTPHDESVDWALKDDGALLPADWVRMKAGYDAYSRTLTAFGGILGGAASSATWTWGESGVWADLGQAGSGPEGRVGHALAQSPSGDLLLLFGGRSPSSSQLSDVWRLYQTAVPVAVEDPAPAPSSSPLGFARAVYPNPARGTVSFTLSADRARPARLEVIDVQGRRVATPFDGTLAPGLRVVRWDARVRPGLYLARLRSEGREEIQRITVLE